MGSNEQNPYAFNEPTPSFQPSVDPVPLATEPLAPASYAYPPVEPQPWQPAPVQEFAQSAPYEAPQPWQPAPVQEFAQPQPYMAPQPFDPMQPQPYGMPPQPQAFDPMQPQPYGMPPQPQPYYGQPFAPAPVAQKNTQAVASLIVGIVGILAFGLILGIIAITLGVQGRKNSYRRGMATAGLVLGIIDIIGWAFFLLVSYM